MTWKKTAKKPQKATPADLRQGTQDIDQERETIHSNLSALQTELSQTQLSKALEEKASRNLPTIQKEIDSYKATLAGMEKARATLESYLSQAEEAEKQERRAQLEKEKAQVADERKAEYEKALKLLAQASFHLWKANGGTYGNAQEVLGRLNLGNVHFEQVFRDEIERLRPNADARPAEPRFLKIVRKIGQLS